MGTGPRARHLVQRATAVVGTGPISPVAFGRCAPINRRLAAVDRPADRVAMQPRPPANLALQQTLDEVQPTDLGPLLHPDHLGPPELVCAHGPRLRRPPDNTPDWPTFHPAQVAQFSGHETAE